MIAFSSYILGEIEKEVMVINASNVTQHMLYHMIRMVTDT